MLVDNEATSKNIQKYFHVVCFSEIRTIHSGLAKNYGEDMISSPSANPVKKSGVYSSSKHLSYLKTGARCA
jgi:hypothetical protein